MFAGVESVHGKLIKEAVNHKIDLWDAHDSEAHLLPGTLIYVCVGHHHVGLGRHQLPRLLELVTGERYIAEEDHVGVFQCTRGFFYSPSSYFSKFIIVLLFIVLCVLLDRVFINRCLYVIYK